jgi:hypothetical protein
MSGAPSSFGELDLDAIGLRGSEHPPPPAGVEHTRIAVATVLADAIARSAHPHDADASPSSQRSPPSTSGVAARSRDADPVRAIRELYAEGRADLALALAEELTSNLEPGSSADDAYGGPGPFEDEDIIVVDDREPDEHTMIIEASADSARLVAMTSRRIPRVLLGPKEIAALPMDPRMGFLLGHVDGVQTMEEILDVCAMPEADALQLLERLRVMGAIAIE